jgi:hypothetical protein
MGQLSEVRGKFKQQEIMPFALLRLKADLNINRT